MNKLEINRQEINQIDDELVRLFEKRVHCVKEIGKYKKEHNLPILDEKREELVLKRNLEKVSDELKPYAKEFFIHLMDIMKEIEK